MPTTKPRRTTVTDKIDRKKEPNTQSLRRAAKIAKNAMPTPEEIWQGTWTRPIKPMQNKYGYFNYGSVFVYREGSGKRAVLRLAEVISAQRQRDWVRARTLTDSLQELVFDIRSGTCLVGRHRQRLDNVPVDTLSLVYAGQLPENWALPYVKQDTLRRFIQYQIDHDTRLLPARPVGAVSAEDVKMDYKRSTQNQTDGPVCFDLLLTVTDSLGCEYAMATQLQYNPNDFTVELP